MGKIILTKVSKVTEDQVEEILRDLEEGNRSPEEVFAYVDLIDIPKIKNIQEEAYYFLQEALEYCEYEDENSEFLDIPVSVEWIDYSNEATCFRVTYQSGKVSDLF